jgi:hypothetical protein
MKHTRSDPQTEWNGFRPVAYCLDRARVCLLPVKMRTEPEGLQADVECLGQALDALTATGVASVDASEGAGGPDGDS